MSGVNSSIYIQICAFIYCILLIVVYFNKKRYNSFENKVYSSLIITNFIGLIIDITLGIISSKYYEHQALTVVLTKFYLIYFVSWISLFTFYIMAISNSGNNGNSLSNFKRKRRNKILLITFFVVMIVIYMLPVRFSITDKGIHSYGDGTTLAYIVSGMAILVCIVTFLKNIKLKSVKKYSPVLIFMFLGTIVTLVQLTNPTLILIPAMETFITFLMYFTIENPDVKMIEEYHKAKEISDNANEDKTMFLYNMTNDIRLITKDINYNTDAAIDEISNKKVDKNLVNDYLRAIKENTARFTTMTNEILDVDSIDSASIKVYDDKYNIKLLLKRLVTEYTDKCNKKNISFRNNIASDLPEYLYGDNLGLKNVLTSILDNSLKYTKEGYIELTVNVVVKGEVARLIITIEDSGIGISPDKLESIFYKNKEEIDGSNLKNNLYTARKLITLMGGTIIPSSNYNNGTTMKIVLDQKIAETPNEKYVKYETAYDKKKILLVDDNISTEKIIKKLIKDTNIELDYVSLGKEALDKIRNKEKYDLILLDEVMDPLDGMTVMKKFKDIRNFKTTVILLTRNNEYEYNEEYLKYGFSGYLLKPINKDKLFEIIDKYLK